jgi:hypothetical protein
VPPGSPLPDAAQNPEPNLEPNPGNELGTEHEPRTENLTPERKVATEGRAMSTALLTPAHPRGHPRIRTRHGMPHSVQLRMGKVLAVERR